MEHPKITKDPEDAVILNEMSGLTLNEPQLPNCLKAKEMRVNRSEDGFEGKSGDVSSDDGNEDLTGNTWFTLDR